MISGPEPRPSRLSLSLSLFPLAYSRPGTTSTSSSALPSSPPFSTVLGRCSPGTPLPPCVPPAYLISVSYLPPLGETPYPRSLHQRRVGKGRETLSRSSPPLPSPPLPGSLSLSFSFSRSFSSSALCAAVTPLSDTWSCFIIFPRNH